MDPSPSSKAPKSNLKQLKENAPARHTQAKCHGKAPARKVDAKCHGKALLRETEAMCNRKGPARDKEARCYGKFRWAFLGWVVGSNRGPARRVPRGDPPRGSSGGPPGGPCGGSPRGTPRGIPPGDPPGRAPIAANHPAWRISFLIGSWSGPRSHAWQSWAIMGPFSVSLGNPGTILGPASIFQAILSNPGM